MKIEDPRSVTSSPILRPTPPPTNGAARPEVARPQNASAPAGQPAARAELSARSRELHQALEAANAAPDVRADKVADAKARIAQGTYKVDAEHVAQRILDTRA
jgi:negative regulator of flagellin synthesis FlgM